MRLYHSCWAKRIDTDGMHRRKCCFTCYLNGFGLSMFVYVVRSGDLLCICAECIWLGTTACFCSDQFHIDKRMCWLLVHPHVSHRQNQSKNNTTGHLHRRLSRTLVHTNYCTCACIRLPTARRAEGVHVIGRNIVTSDAVIIIVVIPRVPC